MGTATATATRVKCTFPILYRLEYGYSFWPNPKEMSPHFVNKNAVDPKNRTKCALSGGVFYVLCFFLANGIILFEY